MDEARRNQLDVLEDIDENTEGSVAAEQAAATALGAPTDASATTDTGTFSLVALTKRLLTKLPGLGQKNAAGSVSVVLSSDGPFATNFGVTSDAAAAADNSDASHMSFLKRLVSKIPTVGTKTAAASLPVTLASNEGLLTATGDVDDAKLQSLTA